jgi:archaeosine synthase beta-subunit
MLSPREEVKRLYQTFGQRKQMGDASRSPKLPHYFLHRRFIEDQDLLIIFNTKRCQYQCHFCELPAKSSRTPISGEDILAQFMFVMNELRHSLSVLTRITLSNEGSILDTDTFPKDTLLSIAECINEIRLIRRVVIETRLEFVEVAYLKGISSACPRARIDVLTGFETLDEDVRDRILYKCEPIPSFLTGLDRVAQSGCDLTAYVLFKPSFEMSDEEGCAEAERSIDFLADNCRRRGIGLTVRLNPMYVARGSVWAMNATGKNYKPPRLSDVLAIAIKKRSEGIPIYVGLSTEGLDEGNYRSREDFTPALIKQVKLFNDKRL